MNTFIKNLFRGVNLKPTTSLFYDTETYTKEQVEAMIREKSDASYKAGLAKAQNEAKENADKAELERYRQEAQAQKAKQELNGIVEALKADDLKEYGIKGTSRFANEYKDQLLGKSGDELKQALNSIRDKADDETKGLFFGSSEVNASGTLLEAALGGAQPKPELQVERYSNSTLRKRFK